MCCELISLAKCFALFPVALLILNCALHWGFGQQNTSFKLNSPETLTTHFFDGEYASNIISLLSNVFKIIFWRLIYV